eukprot:1445472-Ditylum_brightwellii.AAC.1
MSWVCQRNPEVKDHTRNVFVCNFEKLGKVTRINTCLVVCVNKSCQGITQYSSREIQVTTTNKDKLLHLTYVAL